jgi:hypothetical protein
MRTNHLFASAAVAAVLVMTVPAQAQVFGGAVRGGAGGALAGSFGGFGTRGNTNGRVGAGSDASAYGGLHARRATNTATGAATTASDASSAAGGNAQAASRSANSAPSTARAPARSGGPGAQNTAGGHEDARDTSKPSEAQRSRSTPDAQGGSGKRSPDEPRPVAAQSDASASGTLGASSSVSTEQ